MATKKKTAAQKTTAKPAKPKNLAVRKIKVHLTYTLFLGTEIDEVPRAFFKADTNEVAASATRGVPFTDEEFERLDMKPGLSHMRVSLAR